MSNQEYDYMMDKLRQVAQDRAEVWERAHGLELELERTQAQNAALMAVLEAADTFAETCVWRKHPFNGNDEQAWALLEMVRLQDAITQARATLEAQP